jgi:y4mF family transcriptional regulator
MSGLTQSSRELAARFGALVRERREALNLRQDDLALAVGVGRRFVIDLEAGKPTCQLGKALAVAAAVGLQPLEFMRDETGEDTLLPDEPEEPAHG